MSVNLSNFNDNTGFSYTNIINVFVKEGEKLVKTINLDRQREEV
jgi:hypothetical protein